MNKITFSLFCCLAIFGISTSSFANTQYITADKAASIALDDAKVSQGNVLFLENELDVDMFVAEYEIKFVAGNKKYFYDINATTGNIRDMKVKQILPTNEKFINVEKAKTIAFTHSNVNEKQVQNLEIDLDLNEKDFHKGKGSHRNLANCDGNCNNHSKSEYSGQGRHNGHNFENMTPKMKKRMESAKAYVAQMKAPKYEIEFRANGKKYDYEINAITGDITSFSQES